MSARRTLAWGAAAVAVYLAAAAATVHLGLVPVLPLYDGLAPPPPYRWADPPRERRGDNEPPERGEGTILFEDGDSKPSSMGTLDQQAIVVFPFKGVAPREGEESVRVEILPLAPATLAEPPEGLDFDGNAYQIDAAYASSGEPAELAGPMQLVLRYATAAETVLALDDASWRRLRASPFHGSLVITADADSLGTFVTAVAVRPRTLVPAVGYVAAGAALAITVGALLLRRLSSRARPTAAPRRGRRGPARRGPPTRRSRARGSRGRRRQ